MNTRERTLDLSSTHEQRPQEDRPVPAWEIRRFENPAFSGVVRRYDTEHGPIYRAEIVMEDTQARAHARSPFPGFDGDTLRFLAEIACRCSEAMWHLEDPGDPHDPTG